MTEIVHVGDGGKKKRSSPRRLLVIAGVAVLLLGSLGGGMWLSRWQEKRNTDGGSGEIGLKEELPKDVEHVQGLSAQGKYDEANKYISDQLAAPGLSEAQKFDLLFQQGSVAMNQGDFKKAIESFKQAEAIKQTREVSESIAVAAEGAGDKAQAVTYLKKAITQLDSKSKLYQQDKAWLERRIKDLGGQP